MINGEVDIKRKQAHGETGACFRLTGKMTQPMMIFSFS